MPQGDYGDLTIGRLLLRETFKEGESSGTARTIDLEGQESNPPLTRTQLVWRHDNITALESGAVHPLTFTDKPERNCYVNVDSVSADYTEWRNDVVTSDWKLGLTRLGSDSEVDLQSRLTGVARVNDFSLTGERWHAPPIGHYGYQTGTSNPTTMTRTGSDGAITVYRSIPTGASPRWGCAPTSYLNGRVRLTSSGTELCGVDQSLSATGWVLTNGLVNVTPGASGTLDVQAYTGGAWHSKLWNVSVAGSASSITSWDGATLLRNDPEHVIVRLTKGLNPGRATLDLTLRRGSRTIEGYLQTTTSNTLAAYLATAETNTSFAASGYVTATNDDANGNKFACGSARTFTAHTNGGVQKAAATSLDFWIGVVATGSGGVTLSTNPTFDTNTTGWTAQNGTIARSTAQVHPNGIASLLITPNGSSSFGGAINDRTATDTITPGAQYKASGWFYSPAGWNDLQPCINWYNGNTFLSTGFTSGGFVVAAGAWKYLEQTLTAPATANRAELRVRHDGTPSASDVYYVWSARLRHAVASGDAATDLRNQYIGALPETIYAVRR